MSAILHQGDAYCIKKDYQEQGVNSAAPIQWISNSNNGSCRNGLVLWLSYTLEQKEKKKNEDGNTLKNHTIAVHSTRVTSLYAFSS